LVRLLTARVAAEGRDFVHWGATSQDAIDTATVLQMRDGLLLLEGDLFRLGAACAALADGRRRTLMAGRTLLQQALPIPFGLKAARWLGLVTRQVRALRDQRWALALQFGGASGTLAALGDQGLRVAELLAAELALALPDLPWHAERDRVAGIAAAVGVTAGAMAKVAQDVVLLAQTEVGEAAEARAPGKGGSSAMPQKRNPVDATLALAAARLAVGQVPVILAAMTQEHERAVGGWQAEWAAIPDLFRFAGGAAARRRGGARGAGGGGAPGRRWPDAGERGAGRRPVDGRGIDDSARATPGTARGAARGAGGLHVGNGRRPVVATGRSRRRAGARRPLPRGDRTCARPGRLPG